jgi:ribosome-associated heat shock protein Hsp15
MNKEKRQENPVRIDKWLWAARFFKTRALASAAVSGSHVQIGGSKVKASRNVQIGDRLQIKRGEELFEIDVLALSEQRGPAPEAALLYAETEESKTKREAAREQRKLIGGLAARPEGRPDKRDRRKIRQFILKE